MRTDTQHRFPTRIHFVRRISSAEIEANNMAEKDPTTTTTTSNIVVSPTSLSKNKIKKRVTFKRTVRVRRCMSLGMYSRQEMNNCFYSLNEYNQMKSDRNKLIRKVISHYQIPTTRKQQREQQRQQNGAVSIVPSMFHGESLRGLERKTSILLAKEKRLYRVTATLAVLEEQERQRDLISVATKQEKNTTTTTSLMGGNDNDDIIMNDQSWEAIAKAYRQVTKDVQGEAFKMGKADEQEAAKRYK